MRAMRKALFGLGALSAILLGGAGGLPQYEAADPKAAAVTEKNLAGSERFWPYRIELTSPWQPPGREKPLPAGTLGVLVRIEPSGMARVDFGRDGRFEVPVAKTDIVAQANRIRTGEAGKPAPNFVHAIGPRLVEADAPEIRVHDFGALFDRRGFVAVFADPQSEALAGIASALGPLRQRGDVQVLLFPQGDVADPVVREKLRALDWPVPFVRDPHSEGYTVALRPDDAPLPAVMVVTPEGRVLLDAPWKAGLATEISATLDRELGAPPEATAAAGGGEVR